MPRDPADTTFPPPKPSPVPDDIVVGVRVRAVHDFDLVGVVIEVNRENGWLVIRWDRGGPEVAHCSAVELESVRAPFGRMAAEAAFADSVPPEMAALAHMPAFPCPGAWQGGHCALSRLHDGDCVSADGSQRWVNPRQLETIIAARFGLTADTPPPQVNVRRDEVLQAEVATYGITGSMLMYDATGDLSISAGGMMESVVVPNDDLSGFIKAIEVLMLARARRQLGKLGVPRG